MLTRNHRQEALCRAYVQAVAAMAGVATSVPVPDYGVDLSLRKIEQRGTRYVDDRFQIDLQLRSTTRAHVTPTDVRYDLDAETYEFPRETSVVRCVLVVLLLPDDESLWLQQSVDELMIRNCAYWHSLRGEPASNASSSIRILIPRTQIFSPQSVRDMFDCLQQGNEI